MIESQLRLLVLFIFSIIGGHSIDYRFYVASFVIVVLSIYLGYNKKDWE